MKYMQTDTKEKKALNRAFHRFLPIPVALILLFSVQISYDYFDRERQSIMSDQQDIIIDTMIDYRNYISEMTSVVRTIEADYLALAAQNAPDEDVEALFKNNMLEHPAIDKLRILDVSGMEILRLNRGTGTPSVVAPEDLQDKSSRYFYLEARVLGRHQFLFSALDLNIDNGIIDIDPVTGLAKPTLRITSPLDIEERRVGYLVVNFLMREYLDHVRTSLHQDGCSILMLNEDGYLYNHADDANNFGFCYDSRSEQYQRTIDTLFPEIELTKDTDSFVLDNKIITYTAFESIYDRAKDYFLAESAAKKLILLIYYDLKSVYLNDINYSYLYHVVMSWKTQLPMYISIALLYLLALRLIFLYDRTRFVNLFSDNRYAKSTLRQAIRQCQFINYYQPIINIQDGTVLGIEALSRWKCDGQILLPSMFIDEVLHYQLGQMLDENSFMIVREDRKLMERHPCFQGTFISINCCQQTFDSLIKEPPGTLIRLTEEEKKYIVLELLEDIVFNKDTQERMRELYKHNIIFAIDDFGTGNSNVAFIRSFENLKVKIDRTFVPVDTTDDKERVIIEAFVKMFIDQGLKLIVEGVETREQCRYLKKLGVSGVQGFYFSHPMTIDQLLVFMEKQDYLDKL